MTKFKLPSIKATIAAAIKPSGAYVKSITAKLSKKSPKIPKLKSVGSSKASALVSSGLKSMKKLFK